MRRQPSLVRRVAAACTALVVSTSQITFPQRASAALGSSTASAGSAAPPAAQAIQSFQPDLFTGRATTSIPIAVPPGRKGIQPSLALNYSSSSRNSWVGVGWSLDAGYVERSTKNGVPKYDSSDTFSFMFQGVASDLVQIADGTFRAKNEGLFLRFRNNGVSGWEVTDKSGTRYLFGQTVASQVESLGKTFRWCLDKAVDTNGNNITFSYQKDQGQLYLKQIIYTGHETSTVAANNEVDLTLEPRSDGETSYRSGFAVTTTQRLKSIETWATVGGVLSRARRYDLSYTASARTGRSLLSQVTPVGSDGITALPATTFTYTQDALNYLHCHNCVPGVTPGNNGWQIQYYTAHTFPNDTGGNDQRLWPSASWEPGVKSWGEEVCQRRWFRKHCQTVPRSALIPTFNWSGPHLESIGSGDGMNWSTDSLGNLSINGPRDAHVLVITWLYTSSARTLSLSASSSGHADVFYVPSGGGSWTAASGGSAPLAAGWNAVAVTAYDEMGGFNLSVSGNPANQAGAMNHAQFSPMGITADFNGDGMPDLGHIDPANNHWHVALNSPSGFGQEQTWLNLANRTNTAVLVGDVNADGKADLILWNSSSGLWEVALSTGSSFASPVAWNNGFGAGETPFMGDFNGDGLLDVGTVSSSGRWQVALSTGSSFSSPATWLSGFGTNAPLTGDFNGDGLTDVAEASANNVRVALSNGSTLIPATSAWTSSLGGTQNLTTADINGDGLTDLVRYDRTTGSPQYLPSNGQSFTGTEVALMTDHPFGLRGADDILQVGDFGAKGLSGFGVFNATSGSAEIAMSMGQMPDLLIDIANGLGGSTTIAYQPSSRMKDSALPFILPVVTQVDVSDGMNHTYTTTYSYSGGKYDGPIGQREFLGFARAEVRDAEATASMTLFHQDAHKKGRPYRSEMRDAAGRLYSASDQTWVCDDSAGNHHVKLTQTDAFIYDGDDSFRHTRSRFAYDAYGNITRADEDGFVDDSSSGARTDLPTVGDERISLTTYAYNTTDWILNKPNLVQTLDAAGSVAAQRRFTYDLKGNLTKEEEWLKATPSDQWPATTLTYDSFGNVATVTDALTHTTTNTYDATGTYLTQIKNHLNHTRQLAYDLRFGAVISSTDQNNVTTATEYDVFGRVVRVFSPGDNPTFPTITYQYDLSPVAPSRTLVKTRVVQNQAATLDVYSFSDGLGNTIQTRSPAEDPAKQVVSGPVELNNRGLAVKQWPVYSENFSASYVAPNTASMAGLVQREYDALGRLIKTIDPAGAESLVNYNDGETTASAAGHQTQKQVDAYGRLIRVEEVASETEIYTTTYAYDTLGNLTKVTDHAGNITQMAYDNLGRKISMDDPDMGHWVYVYDAVDNLKSQTDARNVTTNFVYDELNRLTQKSYAVPPTSNIPLPASVVYTYDTPNATELYTKGKLTKVVDGAGTSTFQYDILGRLIKESKTIDGTTYTIQRAYDLLGRLNTLTYPDNEVASYTYNAQGGIETVALGTSPIISDISYNAAGQMTKITYGNGTTTDYSYNPQTLRLDHLQTVGPSGTLQDFRYTFDSLGNVTQIQDGAHTASQSFEYDALSRLTKATGAYGIKNYAYNPIGNMLSKEGMSMTYGLADGSKPHAVTATNDPLNPALTFNINYDANGNMLQKTNPAQPMLDSTYSYDAENRLVSVDSPQQETVPITFKPGWNFFSLPVIPDDGSVGALLPNFSSNFEQVAKYDSATGFKHYVGNTKFDDFNTLDYGTGYQVYCKASADVTVSFTGRLPSKKFSKSLGAGWHLLPTLSLVSQVLSQVLTGLSYDQVLDVNLQPVTQAKVGEAYFVHLTAAGTFSPPLARSATTTFVYDGDGGKVKQITASSTTTFLGEILEKDSSGKTTKYVFAGSQRIASKSSVDGLRFYHGDHLGSTNLVTNSTGQVVQSTEYTPYGSVSSAQNPQPTAHSPFGFTGQRQDTSTGLILFPARAYDPQLGRFIQADTIVQNPSDPQTLNRYSYVRNNPINFVDPSGYSFKKFLKDLFSWLAGYAAGRFADPDGTNIIGASLQRGTQEAVRASLDGQRAVGLAFAWGSAVGAAEYTARALVVGLGGLLGIEDPNLLVALASTTDQWVESEMRAAFASAKHEATQFGVSARFASDVMGLELAKHAKTTITIAQATSSYVNTPFFEYKNSLRENIVINPNEKGFGVSYGVDGELPTVSLTSMIGGLTVSLSKGKELSFSQGNMSIGVEPISVTFGLSRTLTTFGGNYIQRSLINKLSLTVNEAGIGVASLLLGGFLVRSTITGFFAAAARIAIATQ